MIPKVLFSRLLLFKDITRHCLLCPLVRSLGHKDRKMTTIKYLSQDEATRIDLDLFNECGFSVDQLMEMAGLSVASVVAKQYPRADGKASRVLICCGPGNNGGDGLVASRHLQLFGFEPYVFYPKKGKTELFDRLMKQCEEYGIPFLSEIPRELALTDFDLVLDALFGFSFRPPLRPEFEPLLTSMASSGVPVISVDIPSGWVVDSGPPKDSTPCLQPECLISLTAPKLCAKYFTGRYHWLGGRFVPYSLAVKYALSLPPYLGTEQCVLLQGF